MWLTQSYPTNFHSFYKAKVLVGGEKVEDFKEVTDAQKVQIEKADAKWVRPTDEFIAEWNARCYLHIDFVTEYRYGRYNDNTGYFELNELNDISYAEAIEIMSSGQIQSIGEANFYYSCKHCGRTHLPIKIRMQEQSKTSAQSVFYGGFWEAVNCMMQLSSNTCDYCANLKFARFGCVASNLRSCFYQCPKLEYLVIDKVGFSLPLEECKLLSLATFKGLIANAINTSAIFITVHPTIYAKITDETNTEWHQLIADGAAKNVTFTTV